MVIVVIDVIEIDLVLFLEAHHCAESGRIQRARAQVAIARSIPCVVRSCVAMQ